MGRSLFGGIGKRKQGGGTGSYIQPGHHRLLITKVISKVSRKTRDDLYIVECEILTYKPPVGVDPAYRVGDKTTWMTNITKWGDTAMDNVSGFICGVAGCESTDITEELAEQIVGEGQPFAGKVVDAEGYNTVTKSGKDFTVVNWSPVSDADQAEALKAHAVSAKAAAAEAEAAEA